MDSKLISDYIDNTVVELNKYYPELLSCIDVEDVKSQLLSSYSSFEDFKVYFDEYVKNSICDFLNINIDKQSKKNLSFKYKVDDLTLSIAQKLVNDTQGLNTNIDDSKVKTHLGIDDCKKIVLDFFMSINQSDPVFASDVYNALYNMKVYNHPGRSYTNDKEIVLYFNGDLGDLVAIAHEVSHAIAKKHDLKLSTKIPSDREKINNRNLLKEVESKMTESMFLRYLYDNKIECVDDNGYSRMMSDDDLDYMLLSSMSSGINNSKRACDETLFKKLYYSNKDKVTPQLLDTYANSEILNDVIRNSAKIKFIIGCYFSKDPSFDYSTTFVPNNGKNLDNEIRFIYGNIIANHFSESFGCDKKVYYEYLINGKYHCDINKLSSLLGFDPNNKDVLVDNYLNTYIDLNKRVDRQLSMDEEKGINRSNVRMLVRNENGFVSTLVLCLVTGFVMGAVAVLSYIFIVNK